MATRPPRAPAPSQTSTDAGGATAARTAAAGGAAGAGAAGVAAAAGASRGVAIPDSAARAAAIAAVLGALIAFIARKRQADREFLAKHLAARAPRAAPEELRALVNEEAQRDEEFAAKQADRVSTETAQIMALADPAERERRMRGMLQSERRYAEQRSQAMAARAIAAADRAQLKAESPQGAFWQIGIAKDHTAGCLAMNGHFWPWTVLDRVHPPRHPGCTSFLLGYQDAVARGLMRPHDVPDEGDAIRRAANVLMEEAPDVAGELRELAAASEQSNGELRTALIAAGLTTPERFDAVTERFHPDEPRDFRGRWAFHGTGAHPDEVFAQGLRAGGGNFGPGVYLAEPEHRSAAETYIPTGGFLYRVDTTGLPTSGGGSELVVRGRVPEKAITLVPETRADIARPARVALEPSLRASGAEGAALADRFDSRMVEMMLSRSEARLLVQTLQGREERWARTLHHDLSTWLAAVGQHAGRLASGRP